MEKRFLPQNFSEVRAIQEEEGPLRITGTGIVLMERSIKMGFFYEVLDSRSLDNVDADDAVSMFNHNAVYVLGSRRGQTMSLTLDARGMHYEVTPPDTQTIRDLVMTPIQRGDVRGSSFIFFSDKKKDVYWERGVDGEITRYVKNVQTVYEMGPVTTPIYPQTNTEIHKRSFDEFIAEVEKKEEQARWRLNNARLRTQL